MAPFKPCSRDALRVRRHVALAAFAVSVLALAALIALAFWGGPEAASVLSAAGINIGIILTALTGFTGAWFHAAYRADQPKSGDTP